MVLALAIVALLVGIGRLPERSEAAIAQLLARAAGADFAPADYVWEPSGGTWADLTRGRGVVFLGRTGGGSRDVFRARVHVTPGGRPLFAHGATRLTNTQLADEDSLTIVGERAFFVSRFRDQIQSVGVVELTDSTVRRAGLAAPATSVSFEPADDALVFALPQGPAALPWNGGADEASRRAVYWSPEASSVEDGPLQPAALVEKTTPGSEAFPPPGSAPLVAGDPPAAFRSEEAAGTVVAIDGRQLELHLVDGIRSPGTQTGFVSDGTIPRPLIERGIAIAVALPAARNAGAFKLGGWASPIKKGQPAIATTPNGDVAIGAWPHEPWEAGAFTAANGFGGTDDASQWAACATAEGNLLLGSGPALDANDSRFVACGEVITGKGEVRVVGVEGDGTDWASTRLEGVTLVGVRSKYGPTVPLPSGSWAPLALGQPTPSWLPAVRQARLTTLGEEVTVTWIDTTRFDWTLRSGEEERSHRLGGDFPEALPPADLPRARLALGLGVGKRRAPRGLRIDGSTGHRFRGGEGLLLVEAGALTVQGADRPVTEPRQDGTELPVTVDDGALTSAARERGPRQVRQDLCVIGHEALIAEATFDSHEAGAEVLRDLGCRVVLALDRGAEREGWMVTERGGPFSSTSLMALDRPLKGHVTGMPR